MYVRRRNIAAMRDGIKSNILLNCTGIKHSLRKLRKQSQVVKLTINTSNSSIALNGASVISWRASAKHKVEKERSPPDFTWEQSFTSD